MKLFIVLLVLTLIFTEISAEKQRKHKKYRHEKKNKPDHFLKIDNVETDPANDIFNMLEEDEIAEQKLKEYKLEMVENEAEQIPPDPCAKLNCGAGRECVIDEDGKGSCSCMQFCPVETDIRRKVCSNHNETWNSDCELYKMRCLCETSSEECQSPDFKHVHIEYYGECREMPECSSEEKADFPRRMRDWLFNVMRDLADRKELSSYYLKLEKEAEENLAHKWSNAAVWKWCDLDGHPHDRFVSRHELFPIRAPLLALEHCLGPFLDGCDSNNDHLITLKEWGLCLEIEEDDLEEKCEDVRADVNIN